MLEVSNPLDPDGVWMYRSAERLMKEQSTALYSNGAVGSVVPL